MTKSLLQQIMIKTEQKILSRPSFLDQAALIEKIKSGYIVNRVDKFTKKSSFAPSTIAYSHGECPRYWYLAFEGAMFTDNADGTVAGCPNSAPADAYGDIYQPIPDLLYGTKRLNTIACERNRDPRCYECPVFAFCGGDCHQLEWQDNVCGAPKSLMLNLSGINIASNRRVIQIKEI
jgi:radical SAM protein with 4Fe4S-binding SPASM domain